MRSRGGIGLAVPESAPPVVSAPSRQLGLPYFPGAVRRAASVVAGGSPPYAAGRRAEARAAGDRRIAAAADRGMAAACAIMERIRVSFPAIDLRDARELRMVNPHYCGDRPRGQAVRRDRRFRAADTRSPGPRVSAGPGRRDQAAQRRTSLGQLDQRDLSIAGEHDRHVRRCDGDAPGRHALCHRERRGSTPLRTRRKATTRLPGTVPRAK